MFVKNSAAKNQGSSKVYGIRDQRSETGWDQGSHPYDQGSRPWDPGSALLFIESGITLIV